MFGKRQAAVEFSRRGKSTKQPKMHLTRTDWYKMPHNQSTGFQIAGHEKLNMYLKAEISQ